jgi:hypothetical protein
MGRFNDFVDGNSGRTASDMGSYFGQVVAIQTHAMQQVAVQMQIHEDTGRGVQNPPTLPVAMANSIGGVDPAIHNKCLGAICMVNRF